MFQFPLLLRLSMGLMILVGSVRGDVVINEILARNTDGLKDEEGETSEWIELYNRGAASVTLLGWGLSDQPQQPMMWTFPATNLASGGYLVVFASGKGRAVAGGVLHTDFRLGSGSGFVGLYDPQGVLRSRIDYGGQRADVSFGTGRKEATASWVTPDAPSLFRVPEGSGEEGGWMQPSAEPPSSGWTSGRAAIGFDTSSSAQLGLLAYWDFNSTNLNRTTLDVTDNAHPGAMVGAASFTADRGGRTRQAGDRAMNFGSTGNNARVAVSDANTGWLDATRSNNAISVSLWIYGDSTQPGQGSVFWGAGSLNGAGSRAAQAHLPWSDSVAYWDTGGTDSSLHRVFTAMPDSLQWKGRWNHYVVLKNGNLKEIWQNGRRILLGSSTEPMGVIRSFYIGSGPEGAMSYGGFIDDFAIWSRGLTGNEVQALAAGASPRTVGLATAFVRSDVGSLMRGVNASIHLRIAFQVDDPADTDLLTLRMRYSDGFVAYLNGLEVARRYAPETLSFDSHGLSDTPEGSQIALEDIDISPFASLIRSGTNLLAVHGLNSAAGDPEFLIEPALFAGSTGERGYFEKPTPGAANGSSAEGLIDPVQFSVERGFFSQPFDVTLRCATPGCVVFYSVDGSDPAQAGGLGGLQSNLVVRISQTTTLRAVGIRSNHLSPPSMTHTYIFTAQVAAQRRPTFVSATWPDGAPADFEVDARVVTNALPTRSFLQALEAIPTMSIATPLARLFGPQGIYANSSSAKNPATDFEIPVSVEWIFPDGRQGFQQNSGFEIHGNISRDNNFTPKHGFNVIFKKEYSEGKLRFPVFEGNPIESFDRLVLRGGSTDTWPTVNWDHFLVDGVQRWLRDEASYVRDQWVRDAQLDMGRPSGDGTYAHLYLGGLYWGIYNVAQRPDDSFAAATFGGEREDYDVLADFAEVRSGDAGAWNTLHQLAGAGLAGDAAYQRIQGNNPDGSRNPSYPVLLDVTNLVDYMVLHVYIGADDWPNHNWWAARKRTPDSTGFKFFAWDQEISINSLVRQQSSWGSVYAEADVPNTPTYFHARCRANAEFRQLFADRVHRHLFNDGALSLSNNLGRWDARIAELDRAIVAESARWGDHRRPERPYTREVEWLSSNAWMRAVFFPSNQAVAMKRFQGARLYPTVGAPAFSQHGGSVPSGFLLSASHTNTGGNIFYTLDGSDPRLRGGAISSSAVQFSSPIPVSQRLTVSARVRAGTIWSALTTALFSPSQDFAGLALTEIMYHPSASAGEDADAFEFLELQNVGSAALDLADCWFGEGIHHRFTAPSLIPPGEFIVLVRNRAAFLSRYPGVPVLGEYEGRLSDAGERLSLLGPGGGILLTVDYSDGLPWPVAADGLGFSLVSDPHGGGTGLSDPRYWRSSSIPLGTPGMADPHSDIPRVVVNELLSNSSVEGAGDFVELMNLESHTVDIGGWYLSDDLESPMKYRLPVPSVIPAGGFLVIREADMAGVSSPRPFRFGSGGDQVLLSAASIEGVPTGYSHGFEFGAALMDVPFMRWINSQGQQLFLPASTPSPQAINPPPAPAELVITEIHYHPAEGGTEFIEIQNRGRQRFQMTTSGVGTNSWRIGGAGFALPADLRLDPGEFLVLAASSPSAFRAAHSVAPSIQVLGPFDGTLQDSGERLSIERPVRVDGNQVAWAVVDTVRYNDRSPWPPAADGAGPSLHRLDMDLPGDEPANWVAARPTPGGRVDDVLPPRVLSAPSDRVLTEGDLLELAVHHDGGNPMTYQWRRDGSSIPGATEAVFRQTAASLDDDGVYQLSLYNAAGALLSEPIRVTVRPLPFIYQHPTGRAVLPNLSVTLSGAASGTGRLRYQWLRDGEPVSNATNTSLRVTSVTTATEGSYVLQATDDVGSAVSRAARVEVLRRPEWMEVPRDQAVADGGSLMLRARASGTLPLTYRWRKGAAVIATQVMTTAIPATLTLDPIQTSQAGTYSLSVANSATSGTNSASFTVSVLSDSDRDRMPSEWETRFGLNPSDAADAGGDADTDGMSNRDEFEAGTDPRDPLSLLRWESIVVDNRMLELGFLSVSNRAYTVIRTGNLETSAWLPWQELGPEASSRMRTVTDSPGSGDARYYRVITFR